MKGANDRDDNVKLIKVEIVAGDKMIASETLGHAHQNFCRLHVYIGKIVAFFSSSPLEYKMAGLPDKF